MLHAFSPWKTKSQEQAYLPLTATGKNPRYRFLSRCPGNCLITFRAETQVSISTSLTHRLTTQQPDFSGKPPTIDTLLRNPITKPRHRTGHYVNWKEHFINTW